MPGSVRLLRGSQLWGLDRWRPSETTRPPTSTSTGTAWATGTSPASSPRTELETVFTLLRRNQSGPPGLLDFLTQACSGFQVRQLSLLDLRECGS